MGASREGVRVVARDSLSYMAIGVPYAELFDVATTRFSKPTILLACCCKLPLSNNANTSLADFFRLQYRHYFSIKDLFLLLATFSTLKTALKKLALHSYISTQISASYVVMKSP